MTRDFAKIFRHEINFHMNHFVTVIGNMKKRKVITFKDDAKSNWE